MSSPLSSLTPMSRTVGVSDTAEPHTSIVDIAIGEGAVVERKIMASVFVSLSRRWLQFSQRLISHTHSSILVVLLHGSVSDTQRIFECRPRICGNGSDGVR